MINLLPPKRLADLRLAHLNTVLRRYIELTIAGLLVLSLAFFVAQRLLRTQKENSQATLALNQAQVAKLAPVQKEAEQLSASVNTIASLLSKNVRFSDMLTQIGGLMPPGSVLTGLQFSIEDLESPLVISAQVDNEQTGAVLRNNLASSVLFRKVELKSISAIEVKESAATSDSAVSAPASPYHYTVEINAYLKDVTGAKQ